MVLGAALTWSGSAMAQDEGKSPATDDSKTIVVTGSILRGVNVSTAAPMTTLSFAELQDRGINTVSQGLQVLAANGSGTMTEGWNNGSNFAIGGNGISLRGLSVQDTLTLFNGLRMAPYPLADDGHRNFVDLGTIPDMVVDKIDVLKDSASSTYGADAVAGVVNIQMKKQIKGFHLDISNGISQRGDGAERAVDASAGFGDLREKGYNLYIAGTYRKKDAILAGNRDYPFNSGDMSKLCDSAGHCAEISPAGLQFGINADGTLSSGTITSAPIVAPALVNTTTGAVSRAGVYSLLNSAGCSAFGLNSVTLTAAQAGTGFNPNQCQQDLRGQYRTVRPETERYGFVVHGVAAVGDRAELTGDVEYTHVRTWTQGSPLSYNNQTSASASTSDPVALSSVILPVYVCAAGVGTIIRNGVSTGTNISSGCNARNGTLNPNNPYAAQGYSSILRGRYDLPTTITSNTSELRGALGLHGQFGKDDEWDYGVDVTGSHVRLGILFQNFLIPQRIADVAATGAFNFASPWLNTQAQRDYIAPPVTTVSTSDLVQVQGTLQRNLFALPGGTARFAVGAAFRYEAVDNPSANPANTAAPYSRYYGLNAASAKGSRDVRSGFFAVSLPVVRGLDLIGSGRYDSYSSGQSNFSPKVEAKFAPIREVALRGTWSKGFRVPSFNEISGDPTTSYSTYQVSCTTYAAYCASHGNNTYATSQYSQGRTQYANANLKPERSTSWTLGVAVEPDRHLSLSLDYYKITVKDVVAGASAAATTAALDAYLKTGATNAVAGITVVPGTLDPLNPGALAAPSSIQYQYANAGRQDVRGIDFAANARFDVGSVHVTSNFDLNYLIKYQLVTADGTVQRYDGTLSPCDTSSCSGSPKWRFTWANTVSRGRVSLTATTYFTSGYDLEEVDYGGIAGDCTNAANVGKGIIVYKGTSTPIACRAGNTWNVDLSGKVRVNDNFTVYANILNVLDIKPVFDPSSAGGTAGGNYNFNPAWDMANIIGRYFRIGAKVDF